MTPDDGQNGPRAKPPEIPNESNEGPRPLASKPDPEPTDVEPDPEPTDVEPLRRVLLWTLATLAFSAGLQLAFYRHGGVTALSDIPGRYRYWSLSLHNLPYIDAHVEYPVTIGYLTFVVSLLTT
ncbi:MAG TPA: hypothetical protein VL068_07780, partial [Microthrixaceae bacterium]|nr:hypothetical protein [Microthrixaceae bacterium]